MNKQAVTPNAGSGLANGEAPSPRAALSRLLQDQLVLVLTAVQTKNGVQGLGASARHPDCAAHSRRLDPAPFEHVGSERSTEPARHIVTSAATIPPWLVTGPSMVFISVFVSANSALRTGIANIGLGW
ncbi:MAG: hypothetical protein ACYDEY_07360 [Acidimicrobiales bacterium]